MTPEKLLEIFSIDGSSGGGAMFRALVWLMIDGRDAEYPVPGMGAAAAIAEICKHEHMPRPAVYFRMKKALLPIFNADSAVFEALGLKPQSTSVGLAKEIIRTIKRGDENG